MNNSFLVARWFAASGALALCLLFSPSSLAQKENRLLRIGVYDSRAIAVAYYNSPMQQQSMDSIQADYKKAKAAKDEKRMKEINALMKLRQRRNHEQGFSTGSVAGIIDKVKDALPTVAQKAGVDLIVSKWELSYKDAKVETVDVTDDIVALFGTSERGLKWAKEIKAKPPISMERITDDMD